MSQARLLRPPSKADLIPVEILSEVFLIIAQDLPWHLEYLVRVCRRWHAVIRSTPGIHTKLWIGRATQKEVVQAFMQGRKWRLDVTIDIDDESDDDEYNAENFRACFMAASQAASRWRSLNLISTPPHGEYNNLQILQPLTHLETLELACGFGTFVETLMTAIIKTASPNLTTMRLADPVAVPYLVQPACLYITHSLTTLELRLPRKMDSSVNILPHLQRLTTFEARHICLPICPPDSPLPFIRTLQSLYLRSVSVQWMAGRVFPALRRCDIIFPHHAETIQAVSMPTCSSLLYDANDLQPLTQFHLPSLLKLSVKSGQWNVWRGNFQLAAVYPLVVANAQDLSFLRLDIACSEALLGITLRLVSALKWLSLGLASPDALSKRFFRAFVVRKPNADCISDMVGAPSQTVAPLCPSLESLHLEYKRWLRGPDKRALIVALGDIVESRQQETESSFRLTLTFDEVPEEPAWTIDKPVRTLQRVWTADLVLGISTSQAIIPISTFLTERRFVPLPFKEAEYLGLTLEGRSPPLEFLLIRDHMEVMRHNEFAVMPIPRSWSGDLPLFSALRVLVLEDAHPNCLIGYTFPKLERCRMRCTDIFDTWDDEFLSEETKMPVCTRLYVDYPCLLPTFKLPMVHELALNVASPEYNINWEKLFTENGPLSRLVLLHLSSCGSNEDLIAILRPLPLLETLVISYWKEVVSLRALLPMDENGTSELNQARGAGKILALLCPRLQHLQIEVAHPLVQPEVIPFVKDVVSLRAEYGSPLKSFTFSQFWPYPGSMFELIGMDGGFTMEEITLPEDAEPFTLDISLCVSDPI